MDFEALYKKGDFYFDKESYAEAVKYYDQAIAVRPQYALAFYRKGEALYKLGKFEESTSSFWSSCLFWNFKKEPLLMTGRTLEAAGLSYSACKVFAMLPIESIDITSLQFYISSLIREMRIADAAILLPRLQDETDFNTVLLRGRIHHEFGLLQQAQELYESIFNQDVEGKVADRLIGIYTGLGLFDRLSSLLKDTATLYQSNKHHADYYRAQLIALGIFFGRLSTDVSQYKDNERFSIIDSAAYLRSKTEGKVFLSGATQQTFAIIKSNVPKDGVVAEFGVRNGHSINLIARLYPNHEIVGFDSFEGIPDDWGDEPAGSYTVGGVLPKVLDNVKLVHGWFDKTLPVFEKTLTKPLALLNIDCDIYSSTKTIFDILGPHINMGTVIVFDEYINNKTWRDDEFKAFQEWVSDNNVEYEYLVVSFYTKQVAVKILSKAVVSG